MKILLLILLGGVFHFCSFGQGPPPPPSSRPGPPPPPMIYSPPSSSEIEKFSPTDKSFEVEFAGKPQVEELNSESSTGRQYKVYRKGSNSSVAIAEYKADLPDPQEVFQLMKAQLLSSPRSKLVTETDVDTNGAKGREFQVDLNLRYRIVRFFVVGRRVIALESDVTNWHIHSNDVKEAWRKETDRFFSSFKILK